MGGGTREFKSHLIHCLSFTQASYLRIMLKFCMEHKFEQKPSECYALEFCILMFKKAQERGNTIMTGSALN